MAKRAVSVVAALPEEVRDLRTRHRLRRRAGSSQSWQGTVAGVPVDLSLTGVGLVGARDGLTAILVRDEPEVLVFVGLAGALSAGLSVGELLVAERVALSAEPARGLSIPESPWQRRARALPGASTGTALSGPRILKRSAEKKELAARLPAGSGEAVVDMESFAWASVAHEAGLPFVILRAVSDAADDDLPSELDRALRPDGSVFRARLIGDVIRRHRLLGELIDLRDRVRQCSRALEEALVSIVG